MTQLSKVPYIRNLLPKRMEKKGKNKEKNRE